jgi:galactokinase
VATGAVATFKKEIAARYHERWAIQPAIIECDPSAGAGPVG